MLAPSPLLSTQLFLFLLKPMKIWLTWQLSLLQIAVVFPESDGRYRETPLPFCPTDSQELLEGKASAIRGTGTEHASWIVRVSTYMKIQRARSLLHQHQSYINCFRTELELQKWNHVLAMMTYKREKRNFKVLTDKCQWPPANTKQCHSGLRTTADTFRMCRLLHVAPSLFQTSLSSG